MKSSRQRRHLRWRNGLSCTLRRKRIVAQYGGNRTHSAGSPVPEPTEPANRYTTPRGPSMGRQTQSATQNGSLEILPKRGTNRIPPTLLKSTKTFVTDH